MKELVMSEEEIRTSCKNIGEALTALLSQDEKIPLFVCVMRGALNFMGDLMRNVHCDILCDYVQVRSFDGTQSTGKVRFIHDIDIDISGRSVVLVEDVVDSGITIQFLKEHFGKQNPKQVLIATLLDKRAERKCDVKPDFAGKVIDEAKFLVGYGLDYYDMLRNVPYVYVPDEQEIAEWDAKLAK